MINEFKPKLFLEFESKRQDETEREIIQPKPAVKAETGLNGGKWLRRNSELTHPVDVSLIRPSLNPKRTHNCTGVTSVPYTPQFAGHGNKNKRARQPSAPPPGLVYGTGQPLYWGAHGAPLGAMTLAIAFAIAIALALGRAANHGTCTPFGLNLVHFVMTSATPRLAAVRVGRPGMGWSVCLLAPLEADGRGMWRRRRRRCRRLLAVDVALAFGGGLGRWGSGGWVAGGSAPGPVADVFGRRGRPHVPTRRPSWTDAPTGRETDVCTVCAPVVCAAVHGRAVAAAAAFGAGRLRAPWRWGAVGCRLGPRRRSRGRAGPHVLPSPRPL